MSVGKVREIYAKIVEDGRVTYAELAKFLDQSDTFEDDPKSFGSYIDRDEFAVAEGLYQSIKKGEFSCDKGVLAQLSAFIKRGPDKSGWRYWGKGLLVSTGCGAMLGGELGYIEAGVPGVWVGGLIGGAAGLLATPLYVLLDD